MKLTDDPYDSCLCLATRRLSRVLTQAYDEKLAPAGLKVTQFSVLVALEKAARADPARLSVIAGALDMDPSSLTRALGPLIKEGLVRVHPGEDRRERVAELTAAGTAVLARAMPLWQAAQDYALSKLGDNASEALVNLLRKAR